jgi:Flp pilus assembly protein TadG
MDYPVKDLARQRSRGSALVEASLVTMVVMSLLLSIFEFGYIMFAHHTLLHQARVAARYGAVNPSDLTAVQNMVLYSQTSVPSGQPHGRFGLTPSMVNVVRSDTGTTQDRIVITISNYTYTLILPFLAGSFTGRPIAVGIPVEK